MTKYKLNDIAPISQGIVPNAEKYWLLNLDMVESNTGRIIDYLFVAGNEIGDSTITFDTGNVLYSKLRPYLNKVVLPDRPGYATSEMLPLRPNEQLITREYLTYFLRSPHFVSYINGKTNGAKMPRANSADLKAVEINCPSVDEQRKITKILDNIVAVIAMRQQELQLLDELIKSRFVSLFGDPKINDKGFDIYKGSELFKFSSGKFLPENKRIEEGIPAYGGNGIAWYTDEPLINYPTIIIGRVGALCGNVHLTNEPVWITDNAIYIKEQKTNKYTLKFLEQIMIMMNFAQYADSSGQPKITQKPLENTDYIAPPIELQNQFTEFVEKVDKSKVIVQEALDKAQLLFDSLMQQYFG